MKLKVLVFQHIFPSPNACKKGQQEMEEAIAFKPGPILIHHNPGTAPYRGYWESTFEYFNAGFSTLYTVYPSVIASTISSYYFWVLYPSIISGYFIQMMYCVPLPGYNIVLV